MGGEDEESGLENEQSETPAIENKDGPKNAPLKKTVLKPGDKVRFE